MRDSTREGAGAGAETAGWLAAGCDARGDEPLPPPWLRAAYNSPWTTAQTINHKATAAAVCLIFLFVHIAAFSFLRERIDSAQWR
jgi:hypothetical protein